jgi:hypothetical protein
MKKTDSLEAQLIIIAVDAALDSLAKDWEKSRHKYAQKIATVKAERGTK